MLSLINTLATLSLQRQRLLLRCVSCALIWCLVEGVYLMADDAGTMLTLSDAQRP